MSKTLYILENFPKLFDKLESGTVLEMEIPRNEDASQNNSNPDLSILNVCISPDLSVDTSNYEAAMPSFDLGERELLESVISYKFWSKYE